MNTSRLSILLLPLAIVACSDDEITASSTVGSSNSSSASGGTGGDGGSATATTTASTSAATTSTGVGGAAPRGLRVGQVGVMSGALSAAAEHAYEATTGFKETPDGSPGIVVETTEGACIVRMHETLPDFGTQHLNVSAGDISITGGVVPLTLIPDAMSKYAKQKDLTMELFAAGDTITFSAAGDVIPAFTFQGTAPSEIDLLTPEQPIGAPMPVDRSTDFVFTWDGGEFGDLRVMLSDDKTEVICTFPTSDGTGTIPVAALSQLSPTYVGTVLLAPATIDSVPAGDWDVQVVIMSSYTWNGVVAAPQVFTYQPMN